jgi:hypothetical protein
MLPNNCEALKSKVTEFNKLFNIAEEAYKTSQTITTKIDIKIHNEFHYCSRGLAEWVFLVNQSSSEADLAEKVAGLSRNFTELRILSKLQRAEHATRNVFNDSIDLVVAYAKKRIEDMANIENEIPLTTFIPKLDSILSSIDKVSQLIQSSRANTISRVGIYEGILRSDDFLKIKEFCVDCPEILSRVTSSYFSRIDRITTENNRIIEENKRREEERVKERRQMFWTKISTAVAIIFGILKIPEFLTWLFTTFPNLHLLGLEKYF